MCKLIEGGCLCGAVRYGAKAKPIFAIHCYCRQCQHITGAGHASDRRTTNQAPSWDCLNNHAINPIAQIAPSSCAPMKPGRSTGRMPEKVLVRERAIATAGFANDVEAVNQ